MFRLLLLLALTGLTTPAVLAQAIKPQDVVEYVSVVPPVPTSSGENIEVVEMFWYGCPHCYRLEPYIERWLESKPKQVSYIRIPAIFGDRAEWELHARTYYAMETLDLLDRLHRPFFDAIHAMRKPLGSEQAVIAYFVEQGVDEAKFRDTLKSFAVATKVNRAKQLTRRYGIDGVPSLIIEGRYRTGPSLAGTYSKTMPVVSALVEKARLERSSARQ